MRVGYLPRVPFSPTPEDKRRALQSVRSEIEQALGLLTRLHSTPTADLVLRSALLDRLVAKLRTMLPFLELHERTVHYTGGLRHENDDVLAQDYGFPATKLEITESDRTELHQTRVAFSYSDIDLSLARNPATILSVAVPVLRRSAAFTDHILRGTTEDVDAEEKLEWLKLRDTIDRFAVDTSSAQLPAAGV